MMDQQKPEPVPADDPEMTAKLPPEALAQLNQQSDQPELPAHVASQKLPQTESWILPPKNNRRRTMAVIGVLLLLVAAAGAYLYLNRSSKPNSTNYELKSKKPSKTTPKVQGLQLDTSKKYGDKYADGLLPIGDGKYVTDTAKAGYIFACSGYAANIKTDQGGAGSRGPWFVNNNTQYDINKKLHIQGSVTWQPEFSNKVSGTNRTIITNDLPNHTTGVFPVSPADPAYAYDRNPNSIKGQSFTYSLSASPSYGGNPVCMGGQVGVMLSGVAIFNGFDAGGRDAGAWEVQDSCSGHPEKSGTYHYHTLSSCIKDISVNTVIGFALDGFPITGPKVGDKNILTTSDLDECHGIANDVILDGKKTNTYHYVMTQDFPYSASCFRAQSADPPGQPASNQSQPPR